MEFGRDYRDSGEDLKIYLEAVNWSCSCRSAGVAVAGQRECLREWEKRRERREEKRERGGEKRERGEEKGEERGRIRRRKFCANDISTTDRGTGRIGAYRYNY